MQNKKLLLLGGNYYPEPTGIGKYSGEMIDWLATNQFACSVVTTYPYYPEWRVHHNYLKKRFWFRKEVKEGKENSLPVKIFRCPHYVPTSPTGLKRLISDFSFFITSYVVTLYLICTSKYDYIIAVAPSFSTGLLAILYKMVRGGKFIYHIQDLQIDAAKELQLIRYNFILNLFFRIEKFILSQADSITTISEGMKEKVQGKCTKEVKLFPNWCDTEAFYPIPLRSAIKKKFGFSETDRIVLYSGAIGVKQGLEAIIHAGKYFENNPHIKFLICGSGPYKVHLSNLTNAAGVKNVFFMPLQSHIDFNTFLNIADLHLVLQKRNARDLVMPSKLSTILAVGGVAIVTAEKGTSLCNLTLTTNAGIIIQPENQEQLNMAVENVTETQIIEMGKKARAYAVENLAAETLLRRFYEQILNLTNEKKVAVLIKPQSSNIRNLNVWGIKIKF